MAIILWGDICDGYVRLQRLLCNRTGEGMVEPLVVGSKDLDRLQ